MHARFLLMLRHRNNIERIWRLIMAVALECINFIVPFSVIRKKYPGGLVQCLLDYRGFVGSGPIWFDEHLFRDGAMNDLDP